MFSIESAFQPNGDQPQAINQLVNNIHDGVKDQILLGVTGSGKTFTIANVIQSIQKPTLVIAPNKTLAAQLTAEFRTFFPNNAVEYFVSYYDYYQPEAYVPSSDTYIEKDADVNEEIDRLRHAATAALLTRKDVIIVASVSCIYGLGSPEEYQEQHIFVHLGQILNRNDFLADLVKGYYERTEVLHRGSFRAHGPIIEIMPPDKEIVYRVELQGDQVGSIHEFDPIERKSKERSSIGILPAKHFVVSTDMLKGALGNIEKELEMRLGEFNDTGKLLEAERLERRTRQDLELMREIGYCNGIENYSRFLTGRTAGQAPYTLIDFFPKDYLLVIDESHVTVPQIAGMYAGDQSRKQNLVDFGFRLPSALDNRPLTFSEFEAKMPQTIYVSATPGGYERAHTNAIVEQIVRPTGLIDPEVVIKPAENQVADLKEEVETVVARGERVLVTTLTKKQAEYLTEYLKERGFKVNFLHSEVDTLDRIGILQDLRKGSIDILVGVNLLREGLDLPEVSLVAILDADKEGFLRSETSLIQTMGRAARNVHGRVVLYADQTTGSMQRAINEANRRRDVQIKYNEEHGITPQSVAKALSAIVDHEVTTVKPASEFMEIMEDKDIRAMVRAKEKEMKELSEALRFEEAALARDEIKALKQLIKPR